MPSKRTPDRKAENERQLRLLDRCVAQDRAAWDEFVLQYTSLVYFAICHAAKISQVQFDSGTVEDLHNGIFLSILKDGCKKLRQFSGRCSVSNWVKVIAVNYTIDHLRKKRPHRLVERVPESSDRPELSLLGGAPQTPHELFVVGEERELLRQAVEQLTGAERLFIKLYFEDGLDYPRIAAVMQASVGAIYARKHRILKKLAQLVKKLSEPCQKREIESSGE